MVVSIFTRELGPTEICAIAGIKEWVGKSMEDRDKLASTSLTIEPSIFWHRQRIRHRFAKQILQIGAPTCSESETLEEYKGFNTMVCKGST